MGGASCTMLVHHKLDKPLCFIFDIRLSQSEPSSFDCRSLSMRVRLPSASPLPSLVKSYQVSSIMKTGTEAESAVAKILQSPLKALERLINKRWTPAPAPRTLLPHRGKPRVLHQTYREQEAFECPE